MASTRKKRAGSRPQSSAPAAQMSRRKNRLERNGKRAAILSNSKNFSNSKRKEFLDDLDQVYKDDTYVHATESKCRSKDTKNNTTSLEMKASSTAVKDLTVSKFSSKKGPDTESKVLPCLPLPPRIESQRKTRQTNVDLCKKEATSNTTYAI